MSQCDDAIAYMRAHGSIDCREASAYLGVAELHTRLHYIRKMGYTIGKAHEPFIDRHGVEQTGWRYWIISEPEGNI